jgi:glutathione synthase/RimK-type ligase-like ATP-grasp enzyme
MSVLAGRRIQLWVEARGGLPAVNPVMQQLMVALDQAGARVTVRVPEHELIDPDAVPAGGWPDLVLLKTATTLALSLAVADEARGVRFLNSAAATLRVHDKAAVVARLAAAGVPVPATVLVDSSGRELASAPDGPGAWVSKPTRGIHGCGVIVHERFPRRPEAVTAAGQVGAVIDDGTFLIQRRVGGDEPDVKVYVAGESCFAGVKRFGPTSYASDDVGPIELDGRSTAVVRAVGEALQLRCFGVDLRHEGPEPYVIDANPFPGYRGFPMAVHAIRAEIELAIRRGVPWPA